MIYFYSADYQSRYPIINIISVVTKSYYNEVGRIYMVLTLTDENIKNTEVNGLAYKDDTDELFEIQEVQYDVDNFQMIVNGVSADGILERRVIPEAYTISEVQKDIYSMLQANLRGLSAVLIPSTTDLSETINSTSLYGDSFINLIQPVLSQVGYGRRMAWNDSTRKMTFEIYQGRDLTTGNNRVIFSEEFGTASGIITDEDTSTWRNVCYCEAFDRDNNRLVIVGGSATGADRREYFTVFTGEPQNNEYLAVNFSTGTGTITVTTQYNHNGVPIVSCLSSYIKINSVSGTGHRITINYTNSNDSALEATVTVTENLNDFKERVRLFAVLRLGNYDKIQSFNAAIKPDDYLTRFRVGDKIRAYSLKLNISYEARINGVEYTQDVDGSEITIKLGTLRVLRI